MCCEAGEQGGAIRRGAGGAKGWDRGECEPAAHGPDAEPGNRDTGAGAHTSNRKGKEAGTVHSALPPHQRRTAPGCVLRHQAGTALEDKIVQRATAALLNAIYEEDFLGFSYGFRPGRSAHHAMDALVVGIGSRKVNWILDADIRSFFDSISQEWLVRFLEHRIGDQRIIRLIQKWLKAGILEDWAVTVTEVGTGQGSDLCGGRGVIPVPCTRPTFTLQQVQRPSN
jgi:hypothetical protein